MVLVIGGIASGKRSYVQSLGYGSADFSHNLHTNAPVLAGLEELLRQGPLDSRCLEAVASKEVVICCEVGSGVVPVDADERAWRERVGRTCSELAGRAERVVRLICGIPVELKPSHKEEESNHA